MELSKETLQQHKKELGQILLVAADKAVELGFVRLAKELIVNANEYGNEFSPMPLSPNDFIPPEWRRSRFIMAFAMDLVPSIFNVNIIEKNSTISPKAINFIYETLMEREERANLLTQTDQADNSVIPNYSSWFKRENLVVLNWNYDNSYESLAIIIGIKVNQTDIYPVSPGEMPPMFHWRTSSVAYLEFLLSRKYFNQEDNHA